MRGEIKATNIIIVAFILVFLVLFMGMYTEYLSIIFGDMRMEYVITTITAIILFIVISIYAILTK